VDAGKSTPDSVRFSEKLCQSRAGPSFRERPHVEFGHSAILARVELLAARITADMPLDGALRDYAMAKLRMDLSAFVGKLLEEQDGDVLREGIRVLSQALMETEVAPDRTGHRNGYRMRPWDTRVGTIELAIPKVRPATYFRSPLQPPRRAEHAVLAVVQEAYVHGVSTRRSTS
jgi:hypothetical protein